MISLRPRNDASPTIADQCGDGMLPRARHELTVESDNERAVATSPVPPSPSMMESTFGTMTTDIVRTMRTSQVFANRETTFEHGRASIASMLIDPPSVIAARLRTLRLALGFKQQQKFADAIGVTKQTYNPWEVGKKPDRVLTFESACVIRQKFQIPVDYLFWGAQEDAIPSKTLEQIRFLEKKRRAA